MNNPHHTTHEALLVKYLLGESSLEENKAVEQWLNADPANRHFYEHFKLIWQQSRHLDNDLPAEKNDREDAAWEKFRNRIHTDRSASGFAEDTTPFRTRKTSTGWWRIAAIFLLAVSVTGGLFLLRHHDAQNIADRITHTENNIVTDSLPDGSAVTLNKRSSISYKSSFGNKDRQVQLNGEAFFFVAPHKEEPFHVTTNGISITVLGTSFNVKDSGQATIVTVETGMVRVANAHDSLLLQAGESMVLTAGDNVLTRRAQPAAFYKYYHPRDFSCDHTPLWQLAAALEDPYNVTIQISKPELRNLPINAEFRNESLDQILKVIQETLQVQVTRSGNTIIIH